MTELRSTIGRLIFAGFWWLLSSGVSNVATAEPAAKVADGEAANAQAAAPQPTSASDSLSKLKVRDGFEVQLVAAEPLVQDPVAIAWGADGKLWVAEMADYPLGLDNQGAPCGRVRFLEDTNGDGAYDKSTLFMEGVNFPNGITPWRKGVLVTAAPEIFYAEDTDGDGKADIRKTLFSGFIEGNPQLRVNGLQWGLDGWLYCANGWSGGVIKSELTGETVDIRGRDLRVQPDTGKMDPLAGVTEFGRNRNAYGDWFGCDNSNPLWHFVLEDRYTRRNPHVAPPDPRRQLMAPANPQVFPISQPQKRYHSLEQSGRFTSACGAMVYGDNWLLPQTSEQHAFVCEPVHNLVHHELLTDDGVSFRRARGEEQSEFLASTDPWFRPVMTRTGPDGALWVVDMYRYMIEHPNWLPPEGKQELAPYYRLGEDRGRIYRIVPKGHASRPIPRLDKLSSPQWVATLESLNDWQRDTAQQLLAWRNDPVTIESLQSMVRNGKQPTARLQALATLALLKAAPIDLVAHALADRNPAVRREAIRVAELQETQDRQFISVVANLKSDPDAKVLLQLASALGKWSTSEATQALSQLLMTHRADSTLTAAALSSLTADNIDDVLANVLADREALSTDSELLQPLLVSAVGYGKSDAVARALATIMQPQGETFAPWQMTIAARVLEAFKSRKLSFDEQMARASSSGETVLRQFDQLFGFARRMVEDGEAHEMARIAAVQLLGYDARQFEADCDRLSRLLLPLNPQPLQLAAVEQLSRQNSPYAAKVLLNDWSDRGPIVRARGLTSLVGRTDWAAMLLDKIVAGEVPRNDIDATSRQQLLASPDESLQRRAQEIFSLASNSDRQHVIEQYQSALNLPGNQARGQELFQKRCATCHRLNGVGYEVGPNLASLTDKSLRSLLAAILDPSRAVETRYANYLAITQDGRSFTGILASETGNSIVLLAPEGKGETILRNDLEALRSTGKSLMPEGFEREFNPQDLADLMAYVAGQLR